jgi:hypothetical protein
MLIMATLFFLFFEATEDFSCCLRYSSDPVLTSVRAVNYCPGPPLLRLESKQCKLTYML